jgi:hypothetical protein
MSSTGWRNLCFVLGAACIAQLWRDHDRDPDPVPISDCSRLASVAHGQRQLAASERSPRPHDEAQSAGPARAAANDGLELYGFTVPPWALWLAPHPGEDLRSYRDRLLPLAQAAIAPQRARVARNRDSFAALAKLDAHQQAELDAAAQTAAAALQDRVIGAVIDGELSASAKKPMTGIAIARDLLDIVGRGNRRFIESLDTGQRARLALHPFDFADYLVFSTPWEDALGSFDDR